MSKPQHVGRTSLRDAHGWSRRRRERGGELGLEQRVRVARLVVVVRNSDLVVHPLVTSNCSDRAATVIEVGGTKLHRRGGRSRWDAGAEGGSGMVGASPSSRDERVEIDGGKRRDALAGPPHCREGIWTRKGGCSRCRVAWRDSSASRGKVCIK